MEPSAIVSDQPTLEAYCKSWRAAGRFVFDTEFIRDETYDAALCLVQVAAGDEVVLIDPIADVDITPFWELVVDPDVITIIHAGKEDFEVCLRHTGKAPHNVFDVQIAAGFVGLGYPMNLTRLVEQVLRKRLAKDHTLTDWLRRPLTDDQIRYAVEDVAYLPRIYEKLCERLQKAGRCEWAAAELRVFEDPEFYRPPSRDKLFRLKGSKKLDALGLTVLERLMDWRDQWAREKNRPIRALIRDDILVEIARRRPKKQSDLAVLRGFPQARNPRIIKQILAIIEQAREVPHAERPKAHKPREETPMMKATLDVLSAVARAVCVEERLSHELLGGTQRLRELIDFDLGRTKETPALLRGWREDFIGRRLIDLLEGRSEIHLSGWPDNPRLDVITHTADPPAS